MAEVPEHQFKIEVGVTMVRLKKGLINKELLEAALLGMELRKKQLDNQIQEVRSRLSGSNGHRHRSSLDMKNGHNRISAAGRRRISAAQKRRWAEYRKSAHKSY
jgi:hypothetical protein